MKLSLLTILSLLLFSTNVHLNAQGNEDDSINQLWKKNVAQLTNSDSVSIYINLQGAKYDPGFNTATEIPFFCDSHYLTGNVIINHFRLENLPLIYDIYTDELIYNSILGLYKLRKEMVEQFSLFDSKNLKHDFVNLSFTTNNSEFQNGYFEVVYNNVNNTVYVKRKKELVSTMKPNSIENNYVPFDKYYLYHKGQYYYLKNLKSLIKTLNKSSDELKSFIKNKKFSKRKLIEKQTIETISFFDSL